MTAPLLHGVAVNPAAPTDVLLRLLTSRHKEAWSPLCRRRREFPDAVVDAIVTHPEPRVRADFVRNPYVDGEVRGRLVDDLDWIVRAHFAGGPGHEWLPQPLPDWVVDRMYTTYGNEELGQLTASRQVPHRILLGHATHPMASIRSTAVQMWAGLPEERRAALLADPHPAVRAAIERRMREEDAEENERQLNRLPPHNSHARSHILVNRPLTRAVVDSLLHGTDEEDHWVLAHNHSTPPDVVALMAASPDTKVRLEVAGRAVLAREVVELLAHDRDPGVRTTVSVRPELTEAERAAIDYVVDQDEDFSPIPHHTRPPRDPALTMSRANSAHPLLRRHAATDPALPAAPVALLAEDDDLGVRVLLAQNHPAPPPELLLRCHLEYTGRERDHLTTRPGFPVTGLAARFADAEDPAVRRLATLDPELQPACADALTRDPDPGVRAAAARHPRLPPRRLLALLDDEELAGDGAANPGLPLAVMYGLLGA
ncbi:translation initiation factor 2 [Streptomyces sp. NPDC059881]|uniref:translation initiation factor 2 n=1 Tax=Streptomyces sp. NPDC059881 TaxID=3346986 RepID=UPI00364808FB